MVDFLIFHHWLTAAFTAYFLSYLDSSRIYGLFLDLHISNRKFQRRQARFILLLDEFTVYFLDLLILDRKFHQRQARFNLISNEFTVYFLDLFILDRKFHQRQARFNLISNEFTVYI